MPYQPDFAEQDDEERLHSVAGMKKMRFSNYKLFALASAMQEVDQVERRDIYHVGELRGAAISDLEALPEPCPMKMFALAACMLLLSGVGHAQQPGHAHSPAMMHLAAPAAGMAGQPSESGQSAFAAIQEIVAFLEASPATDWSKVDIEALRQHLIDMNSVTIDAVVTAQPIEGDARFRVSGAGRVRDAIRRMTTAHAVTMSGIGGWTFMAEEQPDGATLTVTVSDPADVAKVRALGFVGVLTRGMHHQAHHLIIASGLDPRH